MKKLLLTLTLTFSTASANMDVMMMVNPGDIPLSSRDIAVYKGVINGLWKTSTEGRYLIQGAKTHQSMTAGYMEDRFEWYTVDGAKMKGSTLTGGLLYMLGSKHYTQKFCKRCGQ